MGRGGGGKRTHPSTIESDYIGKYAIHSESPNGYYSSTKRFGKLFTDTIFYHHVGLSDQIQNKANNITISYLPLCSIIATID